MNDLVDLWKADLAGASTALRGETEGRVAAVTAAIAAVQAAQRETDVAHGRTADEVASAHRKLAALAEAVAAARAMQGSLEEWNLEGMDGRVSALDEAVRALRAAHYQHQADAVDAHADTQGKIKALNLAIDAVRDAQHASDTAAEAASAALAADVGSKLLTLRAEWVLSQDDARVASAALLADVDARLDAVRDSVAAAVAEARASSSAAAAMADVEARMQALRDEFTSELAQAHAAAAAGLQRVTARVDDLETHRLGAIDAALRALQHAQEEAADVPGKLAALDAAVAAVRTVQAAQAQEASASHSAAAAFAKDVEAQLRDLKAAWDDKLLRTEASAATKADEAAAAVAIDMMQKMVNLRTTWEAEMAPVLAKVDAVESTYQQLDELVGRQWVEQRARFAAIEEAHAAQKASDEQERAAAGAARAAAFADIALRLDAIAANMQSFAAADAVADIGARLGEATASLASRASAADLRACVDQLAALTASTTTHASVDALQALQQKVEAAMAGLGEDTERWAARVRGLEATVYAQLAEVRRAGEAARAAQKGREATTARALAAAAGRLDSLESKVEALCARHLSLLSPSPLPRPLPPSLPHTRWRHWAPPSARSAPTWWMATGRTSTRRSPRARCGGVPTSSRVRRTRPWWLGRRTGLRTPTRSSAAWQPGSTRWSTAWPRGWTPSAARWAPWPPPTASRRWSHGWPNSSTG